MNRDQPVVIVGAGVAGLAAATKLTRTGRKVVLLEARDRIGGRILTLRDPALAYPIELGAEFVHGMAPEIWAPLQQEGAKIVEVEGDAWCFENTLKRCDFFDDIDSILDRMNDREPDISFMRFLDDNFPNVENDARLNAAKQRALNYVVGFNAADPERVGVHWLVKGMRAEKEIEGERAFRCVTGYKTLVNWFRRQIANKAEIRTNTVVERVGWSADEAEVGFLRNGVPETLKACQVLITVPLAVLRANPRQVGAIEFFPALPDAKLKAMEKMETGAIVRVVLRFRERFWETMVPAAGRGKSLAGMSFLFSQDEWFPTWWTAMPATFPVITGWAPFRSAERLSGQDGEVAVQRALLSLSKLLGVELEVLKRELAQAHFHDWQSDPFSRGAYSYGCVGADGAQESLAAPVENTLFFAGEATDVTGHNGTVHGAIASGYRAADEILSIVR